MRYLHSGYPIVREKKVDGEKERGNERLEED